MHLSPLAWTSEVFCNTFAWAFQDQNEKFGRLDASKLGGVLGAMHLPAQISGPNDFEATRVQWESGHKRMLIFTTKNLTPGKRHEDVKHCSVLTGIAHGSFSFWTPCQDGTDAEFVGWTECDWLEIGASGHFLF